MAEAAELKHMIMSFRVSELQVLLGFAGRNKSGRKQELLQRALQLVQKGCGLQVQIKIRELYRQIFASNAHRRRFNETATISPGQVDPQAPTPGIASGFNQRSSQDTTVSAINSYRNDLIGVLSNRSRPNTASSNSNGITHTNRPHSNTAVSNSSRMPPTEKSGRNTSFQNSTSMAPPNRSRPTGDSAYPNNNIMAPPNRSNTAFTHNNSMIPPNRSRANTVFANNSMTSSNRPAPNAVFRNNTSMRSSNRSGPNSNMSIATSNRSGGNTTAPNNNRAGSSCISQNNNKGIDYGGKHLASLHQPPPSTMPVHPDVRFKHLPFYDLLAELMKPTSLVPKSNNRFQESFFVFHLTPQQAQDIAMSRDFRPGAKYEYTVQVQLRFCLLETSCEQSDNFPPSICVRVNGKMAPLPNPIPTTKPGIEPKRPGRAIDITSLCRLSPTISNHLDVSWASEFGRVPVARTKKKGSCDRPLNISELLELKASKPNNILVSWSSEEGAGYCLSVFLVRRLTSDILLQRLKQFGNRHPDHTRALIKEKLVQDPDSEIATTSLRVSLMCPLGKMRLQIPCRASTCTHLQCYDACTFLMMNEKKSTWICPVCDKPASFDKLIIDGYFLEIFRASPECSEIQFHPDGTWSPLEQPKETHVISSPVVKVTTKPEPATTSTTSATSTVQVKKDEPDVIDLTLDSSEEEEEEDETEEEAVVPKVVSENKGPEIFNTSASPILINDSIDALDLSPSGRMAMTPTPSCPPNFQDISSTLPHFERMQTTPIPVRQNEMEKVSIPSSFPATTAAACSSQAGPADLRMMPPTQKSAVPILNPSRPWDLPGPPPPLIPIDLGIPVNIPTTLPANTVTLPNFLEEQELFTIMNNESGQMVMMN